MEACKFAFQTVINGSEANAIREAKKTAETHIEEFFKAECKSFGLAKRNVFAAALAVAVLVFVVVPLTIGAIKIISDISDNEAEIKKLKQRMNYVEYETGLLNQTIEVRLTANKKISS